MKGAIVTGGSSGIGLGLTSMLVELGFGVTIVARGEERLNNAATELRRAGGTVSTIAADAGSADAFADIVDRHKAEYGRLDALVNCAGLATPSQPGRLPPAEVAASLAIDLSSVIYSYWAALDLLLDTARTHGGARVINVASITARAPQPWLATYSAAKAAVVSYSNSMNQAYASEGLISTIVAPGYVATPMSERARDIAQDDMITVADVADVVRPLFTLSPNAYVSELVIARRASKDGSGL